VALLLISSYLPAAATRQAAELVTTLKQIFPESRLRLDGAIETKDGELYLPLLPPQIAKKTQVKLVEGFTASAVGGKRQFLFFDNGVSFLRVITSGKNKTFPALSLLNE